MPAKVSIFSERPKTAHRFDRFLSAFPPIGPWQDGRRALFERSADVPERPRAGREARFEVQSKAFRSQNFLRGGCGGRAFRREPPRKKGIICRDCPLFLRLVSFCHSEEPSDEESVSKRRLLTVLCLLPSSLQNRARLQAHAAFVGRLGLSILQ